eukprot:131178_1
MYQIIIINIYVMRKQYQIFCGKPPDYHPPPSNWSYTKTNMVLQLNIQLEILQLIQQHVQPTPNHTIDPTEFLNMVACTIQNATNIVSMHDTSCFNGLNQ